MSHVTDRMLAYLEETLQDAERSELEQHVAACPHCARTLRRMRLGHSAARTWKSGGAAPARLERRLRASLTPVRTRSPARAAMAALAAFLAGLFGYFLGARAAAPTAPATGPAFALFFEERDWPPSAPLDRAGYAEHAQRLRADDAWIAGEKLTDDAGWLVQSDGSAVRPRDINFSGWFLVRAPDYDAAIAIARSSPHRRFGGVLVRQIE